ncbi:hypothetical protein ACFT5B_08705 [Luteimicrobium sp. NPDC057192]|uniref:hypothetical protein n=1 Tax=Luteimicrobium sp. NPDC057192 TaxID=3346042 RepID=UPI003644D618
MTHADALFSITRSLWDRLSADIRGVAYLLGESTLAVRFMLANEPDEMRLGMISDAETECIADFWQTHHVSYIAEHLPSHLPRVLRPGERWVIVRYEPPLSV